MAFEPSITDPAPTQHTARHVFKGGLAVESAGGKQLEIDETGALVALPDGVVRGSWPAGTVFALVPGGFSEVLVAGIAVEQQAVAVDDAHIYWPDNVGNLWRANKDGTGIVKLLDSVNVADGFAVDESRVYWGDHVDAGSIYTALKTDGSGVTKLVDAATASTDDMAVDDTHVYWINGSESNLYRAVKADGSSVTALISDGSAGNVGMTVDDAAVYWISADNNIWKSAKDGSAAAALIGETGAGGYGLAVDDAAVYWLNVQDGTRMWQASKSDGSAVKRALLDTGGSQGFAVDDRYIYWPGAGQIMRAVKGSGVLVGQPPLG